MHSRSHLKLHIGLITPYYPPDIGGLSNYARDFAECLVELGQRVTVFCPTSAPDRSGKKTTSGSLTIVRCYPDTSAAEEPVYKKTGLLQMARNKIFKRQVDAWLRADPVDVLEYSNWQAQGYYFSLDKSVPQVLRVSTGILEIYHRHDVYHQMDAAEKSRVQQLADFERRSILNCDAITVSCQAHWNDVVATYQLPPKLHTLPEVIPLGVPVGKWDHFKKPRASPFRCNILYVGRLTYRKGFDLFMNALRIMLETLEQEAEKVTITIVGKDTDCPVENRSMWEKHKTALSPLHDSKATYLGEVDDNTRDHAYRNADIFVAPSRYESFGLNYVEAMLCGIPVIGLNVGGVTATVEHPKAGILLEEANATQLAAAMANLVSNPSKRDKMGAYATEHARQFFTIEKMTGSTLKLYDTLVRKSKNNTSSNH